MILRQKIALENVRFFAYHGFYPEEQLTGTEFIVDITAEMEISGSSHDDISNTINYERLFEIASGEMKNTRKLLESVAYEIMNQVLTEFPFVIQVEVSIRKMRLPIKGEVGNSLIQLKYSK